LHNLLTQLCIWSIGLKWSGAADWHLPGQLKQAMKACILVLHQHGWSVDDVSKLWNELPAPPLDPGMISVPEPRQDLDPEEEARHEEFVQERESLRQDLVQQQETYCQRTAAILLESRECQMVRRRLSDGLVFLEHDAPRALSAHDENPDTEEFTIECSQTVYGRAVGFERGYTGLLEKHVAEGKVVILQTIRKTKGSGRYRLRLTDPDLKERLRVRDDIIRLNQKQKENRKQGRAKDNRRKL
jgi:hypothetical protein